jgi:hypothetical protein
MAKPEARERMRQYRINHPMSLEVRERTARTLRAIGHRPPVIGGNGRPLPKPQRILWKALGRDWKAEFAISLGPRKIGYPTCYKMDIANSKLKVCIEVDGAGHNSPKARQRDNKKDKAVTSLGWTVLRFSNQEILNWNDTGRPTDSFISTTLKQHSILLSQ